MSSAPPPFLRYRPHRVVRAGSAFNNRIVLITNRVHSPALGWVYNVAVLREPLGTQVTALRLRARFLHESLHPEQLDRHSFHHALLSIRDGVAAEGGQEEWDAVHQMLHTAPTTRIRRAYEMLMMNKRAKWALAHVAAVKAQSPVPKPFTRVEYRAKFKLPASDTPCL